MTARTFVSMEIYKATISAKGPVSSLANLGWMRVEIDVEVQCKSKEVALKKFSRHVNKHFPIERGWTERCITFIGDTPSHATDR